MGFIKGLESHRGHRWGISFIPGSASLLRWQHSQSHGGGGPLLAPRALPSPALSVASEEEMGWQGFSSVCAEPGPDPSSRASVQGTPGSALPTGSEIWESVSVHQEPANE